MACPSPNEMVRLVSEERSRRRLSRLQEVRHQEKDNARKMLRNVRETKQFELERHFNEIQNEIQCTKQLKLEELYQELVSSKESMGQGHHSAKLQPDVDESMRNEIWDNRQVAQERFQVALKSLNQQNKEKNEISNRRINYRMHSLAAEADRSKNVVNSKMTPSYLHEILKSKKNLNNIGDFKKSGFFSTTYYHLPKCYTEEPLCVEQVDAVASAAEKIKESRRMQEKSDKKQVDNLEKARLRGNSALENELARQNYTKMCKKLSVMVLDDKIRRSELTAAIPNKIFSTTKKPRPKPDQTFYGEIVLDDKPQAPIFPAKSTFFEVPSVETETWKKTESEDFNSQDYTNCQKNENLERLSDLCPPMFDGPHSNRDCYMPKDVDCVSIKSATSSNSVESPPNNSVDDDSKESKDIHVLSPEYETIKKCCDDVQFEIGRLEKKYEEIDESTSFTEPVNVNEKFEVSGIEDHVISSIFESPEQITPTERNFTLFGEKNSDFSLGSEESSFVAIFEEIKKQKELIRERQKKHEEQLSRLNFVDLFKDDPPLSSNDDNNLPNSTISDDSEQPTLSEHPSNVYSGSKTWSNEDPVNISDSFSISVSSMNENFKDISISTRDLNDFSGDKLLYSKENSEISVSDEEEVKNDSFKSNFQIKNEAKNSLVNEKRKDIVSNCNLNYTQTHARYIRSDSVKSFEKWEDHFRTLGKRAFTREILRKETD